MKQQSKTREKTTLIGHCQVCEREIKSSLGRIAHHGYQRPGDGWQTDSCMGALELAFERGHDALDRFIESLASQLAALKRGREKHDAERLPIPNPDYTYWLSRHGRNWRGALVEAPPANIEPGHAKYESLRRSHLQRMDNEIDSTEQYLAYQRARRAGWVLKDLASVSEEIEQKSAAERAARKAEAEARRAERKAKEDAKRAKLEAKYAVPCEFAVEPDGRLTYCWSHGSKGDQPRYRHLPRQHAPQQCWRAQSYAKYGTE